jgi:hypothetical protein
MSELLEAAGRYLQRGWMPVYVPPGVKGPTQKDWQKQRLSEADLPAHFGRPGNIGIILGEPSGGLVDVDLDCKEARELADQFLPATPAVTGRPSAQRSHRWYISDIPKTKQFRDPKTNDMIVELRSTGGQTLVGPSIHVTGEPYDALEGEPAHVPGSMLTACVQALYEEIVRLRHGALPEERSKNHHVPTPPVELDQETIERRALAYLNAMPPAISGSGGHNATYAAATALVHGFGIPPERAFQMLLAHYNPRCQPPWTEKELRHKVEDAAAKPHDYPHGWLRNQEIVSKQGVDLSVLLDKAVPREEKPTPPIPDPGPLPEELLRVPGFVSEVMDHCLETAPYPNVVMAFCGALALQAFLAGRKVRDPGDNRTNIYILGLAHSAAGKEWPRIVNTRIIHECGMADSLGERFASGEGIQDALFTKPCMLFQTDEIDGMLQQINKALDARYENIMTTLLMMYSAASCLYPMRRKAGKDWPGAIDQPCLVIFGTAIPTHYYEALSERMLTNGFFARMLILESGPRSKGQEPSIRPLPPRVLAVAKWWADFCPGTGNLEHWHPVPAIVEQTEEAKRALIETREEAEAEYARAEQKADAVGTTVWGRVSEQTRKLSLLYAVSENHESPRIGLAAAQWASRIVMHQTRRMLFMAQAHVADNPFHAECLKLMQKLRDAPGRRLPHSVLLKRMKTDAKRFHELITTLAQQGDIEILTTPRAGSARVEYRLLEQAGEA